MGRVFLASVAKQSIAAAWVTRAGEQCSSLKKSRAPPILRILALHPSHAGDAGVRVGEHADRYVGWVERETFGTGTQLPNARNPCGRGQIFPGTGRKTIDCGRMGRLFLASVKKSVDYDRMGRFCLASVAKQSIAAAWVARAGEQCSNLKNLALHPSYEFSRSTPPTLATPAYESVNTQTDT